MAKSEIGLDEVKKRAVSGVVVLTGRTFLLSVITLVATGLLTVFLDPDEFGIFWIVSAIVSFLAYFSDVGLAAALIQKKESIEDIDLRTTFSIQQILVFSLVLIVFLLSPFIQDFYTLDTTDMYLLYALLISFVFSSLKTIPSVLLERELKFEKLVIPQVLENLTFNCLAVFLAWKGLGLQSFTIAVLARAVVGLASMYILRPWRPRIGIYKESLRKLLTYGVPYQANTLLATVKDDGMTVFLGGILGASGIGLLGWAQKWGQAPLRFFMDQVIKVTFPAFSRMQEDRSELERTLNRSVFFICFLVLPSLAGLLIVAPMLVLIIPRYIKWAPALIPLVFFAISSVFAAVTTQLTNVFNAIGKIKITFKLMLMWTALTWITIPYLAINYSVTGAAAGYAMVSASSVVAIVIVRRYVNFSLKASFFPAFFASVVMFLALLLVKSYLPINLLSVITLVVLGILIYMSIMYLIVGKSLVHDAQKSFKLLVRR